MSIFDENHINIPEWMDSDEMYKTAGFFDMVGRGGGKIINYMVQKALPSINIITGYNISDTVVYQELKKEIRNLLVENEGLRSELLSTFMVDGAQVARNKFFQIVHDRLKELKKYAKTPAETKAVEAILNALANRYDEFEHRKFKVSDPESSQEQYEEEPIINTESEESNVNQQEKGDTWGYDKHTNSSDLHLIQCPWCRNNYSSDQFNRCPRCGKANPYISTQSKPIPSQPKVSQPSLIVCPVQPESKSLSSKRDIVKLLPPVK